MVITHCCNGKSKTRHGQAVTITTTGHGLYDRGMESIGNIVLQGTMHWVILAAIRPNAVLLARLESIRGDTGAS